MAKGYWVSCYREVKDPEKLKQYAELATGAVADGGGTPIVRGGRVNAYEAAVQERTVIIEFDSFEKAVEVHDGPAYQKALAALEGGAIRDFRIVEGV